MKLFSSLFAVVSTLACVGVAGCAAPTTDAGENLGDSADALGVGVPNPSGAYVANITALGTGCPAGSFSAEISEDGKAFTVLFASYEAMIAPGQFTSVKDCTLAIDLKTPSGFSFAVSSFYYQGYVSMDQPGMTARQTAKYWFMGNPQGPEFRSDMSGPYEDSYLFTNDIGIVDYVWSPCGATRRLNATSRIVLTNNAAKSGSAYMNDSTIDGNYENLFTFGLAWRKC